MRAIQYFALQMTISIALFSAPAFAQTVAPSANSARYHSQTGQNLPRADSDLPLLSVIGLGVLVGGMVSAFRTRSARP